MHGRARAPTSDRMCCNAFSLATAVKIVAFSRVSVTSSQILLGSWGRSRPRTTAEKLYGAILFFQLCFYALEQIPISFSCLGDDAM